MALFNVSQTSVSSRIWSGKGGGLGIALVLLFLSSVKFTDS